MRDRPRVIRSEVVYDGHLLKLVRDELEQGGRRRVREVAVHPGSVAVVAFATPDSVLLVEQYRHAVGEYLVEIPAGTLEPGEDPRACAARELEEETGRRAGTIEDLGRLLPSPGVLCERMTLFVARDLKAGVQRPEDDEVIGVLEPSLDEALEWIRRGRIVDAKTIAALLRVYAERTAGMLD